MRILLQPNCIELRVPFVGVLASAQLHKQICFQIAHGVGNCAFTLRGAHGRHYGGP